MSVRGGRWEATSASVRGGAHERDGRPNQDSVRVVEVGGSTPGLVAAVCDGHGGERYVRSDVGSRFGTEVASDVGKRFLAVFGANAELDDIRDQLRTRVAASIVDRWRERVMDDVRRRPFTDHERAHARTREDLDSDPLISYGCTLVLAIAGPHWVAFVQIGDGDVTVVRGDDANEPMPIDDRLVGGETTSLCLPTAVADTRIELLGDPLPDIVILTSDGYANSFASATWRYDIGLDMRRQLDDYGLAEVEAHLPGWLSDSARAGGDDVSMALLRCRDARGAGSAPHTTVRNEVPAISSSSRTSTVTPARLESGRRRSRVTLLAAASALAVGLGVGWVLGRGAGGDTPIATASTGAETDATSPSQVGSTSEPATTVPVSAPGEILVPGSTDPVASTAVPSTNAGSATDLPGGIVVLSGYSGEGWLLQFDSTAPQPAGGRVTLLGSVSSSKPAVPQRWVMNTQWRFDGAQLCFGAEPCYPAVGVLWPGDEPRDPDLVWATDTYLLRSFDADSGEQLGCAVVADPAATSRVTVKTREVAPDDSAPSNTALDTQPTEKGPATCEPASTETTTPSGTTTVPDEENG